MLKWLFGARRKNVPKAPASGSLRALEAGGVPQRPIDIALGHHNAGRLSEAEAVYQEMLATNPADIDALHFSGVAAHQRRDHERAAQLISQALSLNPANAPAQNNLGIALAAQGKRDEAMACFRKALALAPDYFDALFNLGNTLSDRGDFDEAGACYRKAVALRPGSPEAHFRLANAYKDRGMRNEAVASYKDALALRPNSFEIYNNLGNVLHAQGRLDEAIACMQEALALKPDFADAHFNLGNMFRDRDRPEEASRCYRQVLSLDPEHAEAHWVLAMCQIPAVHESEADVAQRRAAFASELTALDRWFDGKRIAAGAETVGALQPFRLAYQEENNRDLLQRYGSLCARIMANWQSRKGFEPPKGPDRAGTLRVGIVSGHFRQHSVWDAIVKGGLQRLDRQRFSLHAFYLGDHVDEETRLAQSLAARFEQGKADLEQWVEAIVGAQPDVLIYPEVGMDALTVKLASMRLAPVQVASWGHPETTGLPTMDYYLSAEDLEPPGAQANYTERLVTLPHLGCFYQPAQISVADPELGDVALDPELPLLLCPGIPLKYLPQHDWIFPEIARRLGRCRFVFFAHWARGLSEKLRLRLAAAFGREGLDFDQFAVFIPWQPKPAFYQLMKRADVFLDTIGFSGFNTALQAVECGLPIVTREGRFLRGRLASGILRRMGLPELVAQSQEAYVELAVRLARDAEYREHIRGRIVASRHVLFEDMAPIRALEDFLLTSSGRN
jgi:predicted O-linked N-acetylglucosamine transferase (SPINDLY family)